MLQAVRSHKFHLWSESLLKRHNHTIELRMFGEKLVMTDDPENIKAIQETQVFLLPIDSSGSWLEADKV